MNAVVLFSGVSVHRSGNFVTLFFRVPRLEYFSSMSAVVVLSGVSVDRSGNFVTPFFVFWLIFFRRWVRSFCSLALTWTGQAIL